VSTTEIFFIKYSPDGRRPITTAAARLKPPIGCQIVTNINGRKQQSVLNNIQKLFCDDDR